MDWATLFDPLSWVSNLVGKLIGNPIQNLLSNIAGGIETGIVSIIGDVWKVVLPFFEIAGGVIIIILTLMVALPSVAGGTPALAGAATIASLVK